MIVNRKLLHFFYRSTHVEDLNKFKKGADTGKRKRHQEIFGGKSEKDKRL